MSTERAFSGTLIAATLCPNRFAACGSMTILSSGSYTTWSVGMDSVRCLLECFADPLDLRARECVRAVLDVEQPAVFEILSNRAAVLLPAAECAEAIERGLVAHIDGHAEVAQRIA